MWYGTSGPFQVDWPSLEPPRFIWSGFGQKIAIFGALDAWIGAWIWKKRLPHQWSYVWGRFWCARCTMRYEMSEPIWVFHYISHNNALPFSTPTLFFSTNFQSNFDLYCSPPPLTPLILLTLTLTSNTRGMWTLLLFIFSPCNALQCWFKEIYVLHTLPWDKSQDNVKQNVIFTFWALLMPKGRTISNLWATYIWGIWNMEG